MSKELYSALRQAQVSMGPLLKDATNPHFRSKYSTLAAVIETISEPLASNGLTFIQLTRVRDDEQKTPILVTILAHESGQSIEGEYPLRAKDLDDPQKLGAALTYARRYSLMSAVGLAPEDDDGNAASGKTPTPPTRTAAARAGEVAVSAEASDEPTPEQRRFASKLAEERAGVRNRTQFNALVKDVTGAASANEMTKKQCSALIAHLKGLPDPNGGE